MEYKFIKKAFTRLGFALIVSDVSATITAYFILWVFETFFPNSMDGFLYQALSQLVPLYCVGIPAAYAVASGMPAMKPDSHKMSMKEIIMLAAVSMVGLNIGSLLSNVLTETIYTITGVEAPDILTETMHDGYLGLNIFLTFIAAPVMEELFYRKMILDRIGFFGERQAIMVSAFVFALAHGNFHQFCYAYLLGALFAYIYLKTGQIRYTIWLHMIVNFIGGVVVTVVTGIGLAEELQNTILDIHSSLTMLIYLYGIVVLITKLVQIINGNGFMLSSGMFPLPKRGWRKITYLNFGMLGFILLCSITFYRLTFLW